MSKIKSEIIVLYQQMANHTLPECQNTCQLPMSCCSPEYCEMTIEHAKSQWNVDLQRTDHSKLPLMGEHGCTALPHLRPLCTMHTCQVNSMACKIGDPKWTNEYFQLRDKIEEFEYELDNHSEGGISSLG